MSFQTGLGGIAYIALILALDDCAQHVASGTSPAEGPSLTGYSRRPHPVVQTFLLYITVLLGFCLTRIDTTKAEPLLQERALDEFLCA
jgi:hypothetical protein